MVNMFLAAMIAAASPAAAPAPSAEPAMFVVRDEDTTVYLFGTFHALDSDVHWFDGNVRSAFERSDELILETVLPEPSQPPQQLGYSVRPPSVTPSASFLATTRMALSAGQSQGMRVDNGADMVLRHAAEAEGKRVLGLETLELQLNMFEKMPAAPVAVRPGLPVTAAATQSMHSLSSTMTTMQAAWKRGDQSVFAGLLDQLRASSPDTYRMMFTDRNARWADWVAARMRAPGTVFVAVGAGHLAGPDSLLVRLAERGLASQRVR